MMSSLPSANEIARALGGHVSANGDIRYPRPGGKPGDRSCTFRPLPDGDFSVADAQRKIPFDVLKDDARTKLGLEPFTPRHKNGSSGVRGLSSNGGSRKGESGSKSRSLPLIPFNEIRVGTTRRDVVKGLIPRVGLTIVWGPPKCGKSFLIFDIGMHVALGWEYRGRRVHQGAVVYCAFEGQTGIAARAEAWRQQRLAETSEDVPFFLMPLTLNLVREHADLIAAIRAKLVTESPALIVCDTLNRSLQGSESSDEDMSNYVRAADAVREAFECAVVVVHHCGWNGDRPRGHSSLLGAADATIAVRKESAGQVVATVELMKDGGAGDCFASRLERVEVGTDDDGEIITSCVVTPVELSAMPTRAPARNMPAAATVALDALKKAIEEAGEIPPACNHIPNNTKTVPLSLWRRYAYQLDPDGNAEAKKKAFQRARLALQAKGCIGVWGSDEEAKCWLIS